MDSEYKEMVKYVLSSGEERPDRTGTGVLSAFGLHLTCFDVEECYPLLTLKYTPFAQMFDELRWFIRGHTNINLLPERTRHWWAPWAYNDGSIGPAYGAQLRGTYPGCVDQLKNLVTGLAEDPYSRRHCMSFWSPVHLPEMALPPCHGTATQYYVTDNTLHCQMYQRSADIIIGLPINVASYALLLCLLAAHLGYAAGHLKVILGDAHIYLNHIEAAQEMLDRDPYDPPYIGIEKPCDIFALDEHSAKVEGYHHHPAIKVPVAV